MITLTSSNSSYVIEIVSPAFKKARTSSFLEVNTELTKAELLYRNGEYTKALSTAVDIIEKIKPDSYEMLVNKKSPKAE